MANTPAKETAPASDDRIAQALELLARSNAAIVANTPVKKLTFAEWNELQPERIMPFPFYQNGIRVEEDQLTDAQLELLPKLKEGRFFDRRIHVYRDQTPDRGWHLSYATKDPTDRYEMKNYGRDLTEILQRLTSETPDLT